MDQTAENISNKICSMINYHSYDLYILISKNYAISYLRIVYCYI